MQVQKYNAEMYAISTKPRSIEVSVVFCNTENYAWLCTNTFL